MRRISGSAHPHARPAVRYATAMDAALEGHYDLAKKNVGALTESESDVIDTLLVLQVLARVIFCHVD